MRKNSEISAHLIVLYKYATQGEYIQNQRKSEVLRYKKGGKNGKK